MPYKIVKEKGGFFVEDPKHHKFSNRPLAKQVALKQRIAIAMSEHKKNPKVPMKHYFV